MPSERMVSKAARAGGAADILVGLGHCRRTNVPPKGGVDVLLGSHSKGARIDCKVLSAGTWPIKYIAWGRDLGRGRCREQVRSYSVVCVLARQGYMTRAGKLHDSRGCPSTGYSKGGLPATTVAGAQGKRRIVHLIVRPSLESDPSLRGDRVVVDAGIAGCNGFPGPIVHCQIPKGAPKRFKAKGAEAKNKPASRQAGAPMHHAGQLGVSARGTYAST